MSLDKTSIVWPAGSRVERGLSYLFDRLAAAFGEGRRKSKEFDFDEFRALERCKSKQALVRLPSTHAFLGKFETRTRSSASQVKVFSNQVQSLTPLDSDDAVVIVGQDRQSPSCVRFMQIRTQTLKSLDTKAGDLGIETIVLSSEAHPEIQLSHPIHATQRHVERKAWTLGLAVFVAGLWSVMSVLETHAENALATITAEEVELRGALLARLDENKELSSLDQLAAIKPEERSPQGRLQSLAQVTTATLDSTWWQHIEMDDLTLRLTGRSQSASASLISVSNAFSDHDVSFVDAVADAPGGEQVFTIEIRPGETLR